MQWLWARLSNTCVLDFFPIVLVWLPMDNSSATTFSFQLNDNVTFSWYQTKRSIKWLRNDEWLCYSILQSLRVSLVCFLEKKYINIRLLPWVLCPISISVTCYHYKKMSIPILEPSNNLFKQLACFFLFIFYFYFL